ncbi:CoA transferase [Pontibacillus halophilus JSM 076056 = DSM 19796]|uniref:CoA transferase n=1 Tax=Pontibacillus halophilus JSM 076056 = DSM 19796 TaxID=1385510 RepID=A0A0A5GES3_9BACI|nr:CoA transferase [Pontibacillus halophilus]KGX89718.1 CoA transferase [Pontibacillus halophilus JSM 076056 = DSM 19796]
MAGALDGIVVLDLSRVLAGPYCTMILGDLGAEVIKVEAPGGSDETRTWGPPFQDGVSAYYLCANRNKKSITLDLKSEDGRTQLLELVKESDVVLNNFKTGTMERLGLSYDTLRKIKPDIIYASITGFGETGPYRDLPGYDFIIQAMSGLMSITGDAQSGPQKVGVAITDLLTGLYACIGIQAALLERNVSRKGQKIDLSLFDSAVSALANIGSNYLMSGVVPERLGNHHANIVPYQQFAASDGAFVIAVGNDRQFKRLCELIRKDALASDPRYATNEARVAHRSALTEELQAEFLKQPAMYWKKKCEEASIPCGPIQSVQQVFNDPQIAARDLLLSMNHPTAGTIRMVGSPLKLSRTNVSYRTYPPLPGEHNEEFRIREEGGR